jgi:hypothetical protein
VQRNRFASVYPPNNGFNGTAFQEFSAGAEDMLVGPVMVNLLLTQDDNDPIQSGYQFNLIAATSHLCFVCYGFSRRFSSFLLIDTFAIRLLMPSIVSSTTI